MSIMNMLSITLVALILATMIALIVGVRAAAAQEAFAPLPAIETHAAL